MIDRSPPLPETMPIPSFDPVPRQSPRHDGWTTERQQGFIAALTETGSVRAAAQAVNMSSVGAYYLRRQRGAGSFRKAWDKALADGVQRLEDIAMERALNGTEEPVYSYGKMIGTRRVYNDRLLMFILRNRAPARFSATTSRLGMVGEAELKRLKRQWRKEWEQEAREQAGQAPPEPSRALADPRVPDPGPDYGDTHEVSFSPRTAMLDQQCQLSYDEDCDKGEGWWKKPYAEYRDGTLPGDYPPLEETAWRAP